MSSTAAAVVAAQPTGRTARQAVERAVVEAITAHMLDSSLLIGRTQLAKRIVDRITSEQYAGHLRDVLDRKPHAWNPSVARRGEGAA
jgi:hypothetical protein